MEWITVCRRKHKSYENKYKILDRHTFERPTFERPTFERPKVINPISLQTLIRVRIEKDLNQEESDMLCGFTRNTFKNIESNRIIPTEEQKLCIQRYFNTYLKVDN